MDASTYNVSFSFERRLNEDKKIWLPYLAEKCLRNENNCQVEDESPSLNFSLSWSNDLVSFYGPVPQGNETTGSVSGVGILYKLKECRKGARNYDMICSADQIATSLAGHGSEIMENDEVIFDFAAISECYYFNPTI